ncbi:inorganic phosphate transporter [Nonomuraea rhodomycinica]|uniref:Inorganic phosphate transporter n=1 Tax=Nonomuraea rhodomycinica TaxID=1712872 RepID=A0A7Y6IUS3_9ACTN|nr:inorganic phosphate transporter [Nonomuraea rhodomycinica]NUW44520.1 inorganic phosphate transporter [Nonomuraea rhodomycinica]
MGWTLAFAAVAVVFVLISGANDGATLIGLGLRFPHTPGWGAAALLVVVLSTGPYLLGVAVARTFTEGLAGLGTSEGATVFLAGVVTALAVVGALTAKGLPTSLTLAVIGGITGAGLGAGLPVSWRALAAVLAVGAGAPLAGLGLGYLLGSLSRRVPSSRRMPRLVLGAHVLAYAAQCVAYAVNDGQKMIAVVSVAVDVGRNGLGRVGPVHVSAFWTAVMALVFLAGAMTSLVGVGERLGRGLVITRPLHVVSAETAATGAVLGSSALGSPVSMTQSVAAGVVGVVASEGGRRLRWRAVLNVGTAWLVTLPSSMALGCLAGLGLRLLRSA